MRPLHGWGERGEGEPGGAWTRRVCTRAASIMADGVGARVCSAAADGKGGTSEKGRGEDPRNREDHPVIPITVGGAPLAQGCFL